MAKLEPLQGWCVAQSRPHLKKAGAPCKVGGKSCQKQSVVPRALSSERSNTAGGLSLCVPREPKAPKAEDQTLL